MDKVQNLASSTQIIIPMAGESKRFYSAGYSTPKSLIEFFGIPVIGHILKSFSSFEDVLLIVNKKDFDNYDFIEIVRRFHPTAQVVPIAMHSLGPSYTISKAAQFVARSKKIIVHYCDVSGNWDPLLTSKMLDTYDGVYVSFTGFHPSRLNLTTFAYARLDEFHNLVEIKEKESFTKNPSDEYASGGIYGFSSGKQLLSFIDYQISENLQVKGEFYTSLTQQVMLNFNKRIKVQLMEKFFGWGTPEDLEDFVYYNKMINLMLDKKRAIAPFVGGAGIILAAGHSSRLRVGEALPKQLIQIFDKRLLDYSQMLITDLKKCFLVATKECYSENIWGIPDENLILLSHPTDSQVSSVQLGLTLKILPNEPISFLSSDNVIIVEDSLALSNSLANADVCIWTCENYPIARIQPDEYSWVKVNDENFIEEFLYKSKPDNYHSWKMVTGNFSFKNKEIATLLITELTNSGHSKSKEIMLDNVIPLAIKANLRIRSFDLENYLTLGSLIEEQVFNYWSN